VTRKLEQGVYERGRATHRETLEVTTERNLDANDQERRIETFESKVSGAET
jgi:hypothetical protein